MEQRYDRQLKVSQIGPAGQANLAAAGAIIIGVGGLGSYVASILAKAGIGRLTLVDFDVVALSNLHRQNGYTEADVGRSKLQAYARYLHAANHNVALTLKEQRYDASILASDPTALVIDCTDNFPVKYQLNADCQASGRAHLFATCAANSGQLMAIDANGPCLACAFPPQPVAALGLAKNIGTNPAIVATTGSLEAGMALKWLSNPAAMVTGELVTIDAWRLDFSKLTVPVRPTCPYHQEAAHG
ncbi:HesA/MoeB/ThiF family protein [Lacticaseibacillus baoqingensis]|uniref:HesA/MoeB/ThiF family protein n=1 Tax=Lacticaseibacillus baoqingensis TaxID=2486013 RepID=A0ABW4E911_9LACO|nr:HesA/MoeB/ThiF family protein [Lacticaseibacillus baoqingensis]